MIYNYPGKTLLAIGAIDFGAFGARVGDIEGVRRAVLAAALLREGNARGDDIAAALAASTLRNPYDDAPFEWDMRQNAIVFHGLEGGKRGTHTVFL